MIRGFLRGQALTVGLVAAVALAYLHPGIGADGGPLRPEISSQLAVVAIFLLQGLGLPTRRLLASASAGRFHLYCQAGNFILAPAVMLGLIAVGRSWIPESMLPGLIFLSVLPTTISSAVILTANAGGESSAALFSTTLSNLLGVLITPALCLQLVTLAEGGSPSFWPVFLNLLLLVLVPMAVGQLIRPFVRDTVDAWAVSFKRISNGLILFIVYTSFCESFASDIWSALSAPDLATLALVVCLFLLLLSALVWLASPLAGRDPALRIAAFYCASQKTLASGAPMAALIFAAAPEINPSLVLLPLMIHHPLQLILGSSLAPRFLRTGEGRPATRRAKATL